MSEYRLMLYKLSQQMRKQNAIGLAHYYGLPGCDEDAIERSSGPGLALIKCLEQRRIICEDQTILWEFYKTLISLDLQNLSYIIEETYPQFKAHNSLGRHSTGDNARKYPSQRRNLESWPNSRSVDYNYNENLRSSHDGMRPVIFHQVHAQNIVRSPDGMHVSRKGSFCNAIVFTSRAIRPREPFSVQLEQCTTRGWSGVLRFGYTIQCPDRLRPSTLPKYVCPDMTVKPGNWAKALKASSARNNNILTFFYNAMGEVYLSVNGGRFNLFFTGVDTTKALWGLMDVYGNTTGVKVEEPATGQSGGASPGEVTESGNVVMQPAEDQVASSSTSGETMHYMECNDESIR